jgi:drug/metabolite transporter (DMT)-like permease
VTLNHLLFLAMSLIWGMTWMATKVALAAVPPIFLGAARYVLVSAVLLVTVRGTLALFTGAHAGRVVVTGLLINVGTYGLLYWGMQFVASGVAGVVNMSTISLFLFGFAILLGQERAGLRHLAALALGIGGLAILFSCKASFTGSAIELWAAAAIVGGSACYALGSVLSRPLLERIEPLQLTAAQGVAAALGMSLLSLALEPVSAATFAALLHPLPLAGLLFLVIAGTFIAFTIFLRLVRDWGAPRAGLYAFVSPVVALILGAVALGEPLGWREVAGGALMLVAAAIAVAPRRET